MKTIEKKGLIRTGGSLEYEPGDILITGMGMEEFKQTEHDLPHRIQLLQDMERLQYCKAELYPGCIMGTMAIPVKADLSGKKKELGYYMDGQHFLLVGGYRPDPGSDGGPHPPGWRNPGRRAG